MRWLLLKRDAGEQPHSSLGPRRTPVSYFYGFKHNSGLCCPSWHPQVGEQEIDNSCCSLAFIAAPLLVGDFLIVFFWSPGVDVPGSFDVPLILTTLFFFPFAFSLLPTWEVTLAFQHLCLPIWLSEPWAAQLLAEQTGIWGFGAYWWPIFQLVELCVHPV